MFNHNILYKQPTNKKKKEDNSFVQIMQWHICDVMYVV